MPGAPLVVDLRTPRECAERRIEGSVNLPLSRMPERLGELPRDRRVVVHWRHGPPLGDVAGSLLRDRFGRVADLVGQMIEAQNELERRLGAREISEDEVRPRVREDREEQRWWREF